MDVGARLVDREGQPADIADLRQILDINAVIRQFGADRCEVFALRAERLFEARRGLRLQRLQVGAARWPLRRQCLGQRRECVLGVGDDADRRARDASDLDRVEVDADHLDVGVEAPARLRLVEAAADRQHDIGPRPQIVPGEQVLRQVVPV